MTKLDVINRMLRAVQAEPLASLAEEDLTYEQSIALEIFDQVNTFVQGLGWWFNTFIVKLSPDSTGTISIPSNYVQVDPTDPSKDYVVVNGKLYDKENGTHIIEDEEVELLVVVLEDFDELPIPVQEYIALRCEGEMQRAIYGSIIDNSLLLREQEAYNMIMREQNNAADYNVLKHPQIQYALRRW